VNPSSWAQRNAAYILLIVLPRIDLLKEACGNSCAQLISRLIMMMSVEVVNACSDWFKHVASEQIIKIYYLLCGLQRSRSSIVKSVSPCRWLWKQSIFAPNVTTWWVTIFFTFKTTSSVTVGLVVFLFRIEYWAIIQNLEWNPIVFGVLKSHN